MKRATPLSRRVLNKMVADLAQRIRSELMTAEAIAKASQPRGHTLSGEVPERLVIPLAAQVHHRHLEAIAEFADIVRDRASGKS